MPFPQYATARIQPRSAGHTGRNVLVSFFIVNKIMKEQSNVSRPRQNNLPLNDQHYSQSLNSNTMVGLTSGDFEQLL